MKKENWRYPSKHGRKQAVMLSLTHVHWIPDISHKYITTIRTARFDKHKWEAHKRLATLKLTRSTWSTILTTFICHQIDYYLLMLIF